MILMYLIDFYVYVLWMREMVAFMRNIKRTAPICVTAFWFRVKHRLPYSHIHTLTQTNRWTCTNIYIKHARHLYRVRVGFVCLYRVSNNKKIAANNDQTRLLLLYSAFVVVVNDSMSSQLCMNSLTSSSLSVAWLVRRYMLMAFCTEHFVVVVAVCSEVNE